ncbi:protein transport protein S31 [Ceratobasidium sp. 370]|nr:protein transport protein S31 [Ceratobasidium sp. 370]
MWLGILTTFVRPFFVFYARAEIVILQATRLVTSLEDGSSLVITLWDLRNAHAPERILGRHERDTLGLSWSTWDPDLLLSCGKDNRTICWNPTIGEIVGQPPPWANWLLQSSWNLRKPDLSATTNYDGTIAISPPPPHLLQVIRVLFTGNLDTVVELCTQAGQREDALLLAQSEQDAGGLYGIRAMVVQHFVEKALVFCVVTGFLDAEPRSAQHRGSTR